MSALPLSAAKRVIVLDAKLAFAPREDISFNARGGVPIGKCEFVGFRGRSPLHGFVLAMHHAFAQHRTLRLKADDVWTVIVQGLAQHVDRHHARLRSKMVDREGKQTIRIRRDALVRGRTTRADWMDVVAELSDKAAALVNKESSVVSTMVQRFSTTQPIHTFLYQAAVLGTLKNYLSYSVDTLCGIPRIELIGTVEDWQQLADAVVALDLGTFDSELRAWDARLRHITTSLARCRSNDKPDAKEDIDFLRSMYKYQSRSGNGALVTGWLAHLFPSLVGNESGQHLAQDVPQVKSDAFPTGLTNVPFEWNYHGESTSMVMYAGFDDPQVPEDDPTAIECVHDFAVQYVQSPSAASAAVPAKLPVEASKTYTVYMIPPKVIQRDALGADGRHIWTIHVDALGTMGMNRYETIVTAPSGKIELQYTHSYQLSKEDALKFHRSNLARCFR